MIYAISDSHGCYEKYMKMLELIGLGEDDTLYVLGDVIDRGDGGIEILLDMAERKNVIPITGNHEASAVKIMKALSEFPDHLKTIEKTVAFKVWTANGGQTTAGAFVALDAKKRKLITDYIESFAIYDETEVAGRRFHLSHTLPEYDAERDVHDATYFDFVWGEPDYDKCYDPGVTFVTGHTPTGLIDPEYEGKIWRGNGHIAIDCGASFGGRLGCIRLDDLEEYYV